jgi:hypothetical protein
MASPHELYKQVIAATGDHIAAIRAIREKFGLNPREAKEVMLQVEDVASSLEEHQERLATALEQYFTSKSDEGQGHSVNPSNQG